LLAALPPRRTSQLWLLTLLTLVSAIAELLLVAATMLFLAALAGTGLDAVPAVLRAWLGVFPADRQLPFAAVAFAASALVANAFRLVTLRLTEVYVAGVTHDLTLQVQRRVFAQPYGYHVRHHSSAVIASLDKVRHLATAVFHQWLDGSAAIATGAAIIALLVTIGPLPALTAVGVFAALYLVTARISGRRLLERSDRLSATYNERVRTVQESLGAIRDLIIDQSQRAQLEEFRKADARLAAIQASTRFTAAAPRYFVEAIAVALLAAIAAALAGRGNALVMIGGIAIGGMRVLPLLQGAYRNWVTTIANRSIVGDVLALLALPVPDDADRLPAPLPFQKSIRLEKVSFAYPGRRYPALADVSLDIARGQRIGLVGETGSGKSTLADVVMGLLSPQAGTILIDGAPLEAASVRAWQRNIAHVSQVIFLTDASIARNIAFSLPDVPPDLARVREAAARAGIADFIEALPDGYETTVGERGAQLSGGQRQRIAIARALYKDAPLLVLDEATNALDEETEAKVLANLFADPGRTILIIAHRPSALASCDRLVTLAGGSVVGDG
jgi:ATP-binding cassette subfamily B protein